MSSYEYQLQCYSIQEWTTRWQGAVEEPQFPPVYGRLFVGVDSVEFSGSVLQQFELRRDVHLSGTCLMAWISQVGLQRAESVQAGMGPLIWFHTMTGQIESNITVMVEPDQGGSFYVNVAKYFVKKIAHRRQPMSPELAELATEARYDAVLPNVVLWNIPGSLEVSA